MRKQKHIRMKKSKFESEIGLTAIEAAKILRYSRANIYLLWHNIGSESLKQRIEFGI